MSSISVDLTGIVKMQDRFRRMIGRAPSAASAASRRMADDLVKSVKQHASGRPGPDVITGAYRNSITVMESKDSADSSVSIVGTDAVQAARLEYGFVGVDSLGRHYLQPPFQHWRPALNDLKQNIRQYQGPMIDRITE